MKQKIKKYLSFSMLVFVVGFVGAFLGKGFEKTKIGQKIESKLGIHPEGKKIETAQGMDCVQQQEKDDESVMFVGCNGFF